MAAGPRIILPSPGAPSDANDWMLFKTPNVTQTVVSADRLTTRFQDVSFAENTVEFIDSSIYSKIRVVVMGVASNNGTCNLQLYGWQKNGPGQHIATIAATFGNFTSAATTGFHAAVNVFQPLAAAFLPGTAYQICDTFSVTNDYEKLVFVDSAAVTIPHFKAIEVPGTQETDFPSYFIVDMTNAQYQYLGMTADTFTSVTTVGAIYRPLGLKQDGISPDSHR